MEKVEPNVFAGPFDGAYIPPSKLPLLGLFLHGIESENAEVHIYRMGAAGWVYDQQLTRAWGKEHE